MAFPVILGTAESSTNTAGTTHTVNLPTGIRAGESVLIILDKGSTVATFNALAGYSEVVDENLANGITVWMRDADGTEAATVAFTSSANTRSAEISYRIAGATATGTQLPQLSTVATTGPDATTCTPTGGAKDYLWFTFFGSAGEVADTDAFVTAVPTGFASPALMKACGTAGSNLGGIVAVTHQQLNAASLDAAAFTTTGITSPAYRAYTLAVHPSNLTNDYAPNPVVVNREALVRSHFW
jgi:hypothetical protein